MRIFATILIITSFSLGASASLKFSGTASSVITETPESSTGLNNIYVIDGTDGVTASYTSQSSANTVKWYRFSNLGGAYAEQVSVTNDGATTSLQLGPDDMGYIIEDGSRRYYYWIVNYANHRLTVDDISISPESDCDMTVLATTGEGARITYYTINGAPKELSRDITVSYSSLSFDSDASQYVVTPQIVKFPYLQASMHVTAPLCDTDFTLEGDRFMKTWNQEITVSTPVYNTVAIDIETEAAQTEHDSDNEMSDNAELGGSAPAEITFRAITTDAVIFKEWQIARDADFGVIDLRLNDNEMTYTFRDYGTFYVRFMASNAGGTCDRFSDTYEIQIGESRLECPNAFSPGSSEGVNDEWKVSYKSIVEFECHIFNRWGVKMAEFTDPSQGWDGKYRGKLVPSGVYYYVIRAVGADGKQYKLSGDINIINFTGNNGTGSNPDIEN